MTVGSAWFAHSSIMRGVYLRIIASTVKDSTGLDFDAGDMSFSVLKSRVRLHYPSLDTDFFKADEIELVVSPISLLGDSPHIKRLVVVNPVSNISARRLERIKLKQSDGPSANWKLDLLEISNGKILVKEPEWGLPQAEVTFMTRAIGSGPKVLKIETDCSKIFIVNKSMSLCGSANIHMDVKADIVELRQMSFDSELLKFKATGTFNGENNIVVCETNGSILSQNLPEVFGADFSGFNGQADFRASLSGEAGNLEWDLQVNAKRITTPYQSLDNITLEAQGVASDINLKQLSVRLPEGALISASGEMKETECELILDGRAVPLKALSGIIKMPFFESVFADIQGFFSSKVPVWDTDALSQSRIDLSAIFNRNGEPAGDLTITAEKNALQIKSFNIDIPELKASAIGSFGYKTHNTEGNPDFSLTSIALSGEVVTTAEQVANSLDKWKIVDRLPISGKTSASAHVAWSPSKDLQLSGYLKLENPVYYGATADILTTGVKIDSERLFLDNIRLNRKEAEAAGNLWLTWANVPPGGDQISMRFELLNLPVSEGLDTAISDPKILEDMAAEGYMNGWAALKGPYDSMTLSGEARLHDASVYGVSIPAFSGSIEMNLNESNIHLIIPEFRLADCSENLDSLSGPLGLKGNLDIDLTAETWTGRIIGAVDSHSLGMTNAPRLSAQINAALSGPYAADYGPITLPEGSISLSKGWIAFGDSKLEGLLGNIRVEDGKIHGTMYFDDFQDSRNPLLELNARKGARSDRNNLTWQLQVAFSQETAQTEILAQTLTDGVLEDINLGLHASGRFNDRGLFWRADVNKFGCRISGLEFGQQNFGAIEGNLDDVNLALSLESQTSDEDMSKKVSWFRINGTIPLNNAKITDLG
ncbi:MAG: hypothetical protein LBQ86_08880, partial [Holophagales bacterium]|nr:hypothetical protein [Holophagales bacterium]